MRAGSARRVAATTYGEDFASDPVRVSSKVAREVAGLGSVRADDLRRVLGEAWFAYQKLIELRDPKTGVVKGMTSKRLALMMPRAGRGGKSSETALRQQVQKLIALRLVEVIGRPTNPDNGPKRRQYFPTPLGTRFKYVVDRRVFGAPGLGKSELYAVPFQAQLVLQAKAAPGGARKNSGGARDGAGRPKGRKTGTGKGRMRRYREGGPMSAQRLIEKTESLFPGSVPAGSEFSKCSSTNSKLQPSVGASSLLLSLLFPSLGLRASLPNGSEGRAQPAPVSSLSRDENGIPKPTPRVLTEEEIAAYRDELSRPGGFPSISPFVACKHKLFFPFVSVSSHPDFGLRVPNPPKLRREETPERHAYLLARWYEGACRAVLGKEAGAFKRYHKGPASSPHFPLLKEAATAFLAEDVSPAAWCAFSAHVWKQTGNKGMPPLKFVFSAKRVAERVGWFRAEEANWSGGRVLWTPTARDFAERQMRMRTVPGSVRTEEELRAWVARHFPGDSFYELLERIREETARLRDELNTLIEFGEWVW